MANFLTFSKASIARITEIEVRDLKNLIPDNVKAEIGFVKGQQRFKPDITFKILKSLNPLWSEDYICKLMNMKPNSYKVA